MKHSILTLSIVSAALMGSAQNIQLHYDFGNAFYNDLSGRPQVTTTVEMFKGDKWGSTYFFTDIDYFKDGAAGAYWEFSREFSFGKNKRWAAHIEYDGGLSSLKNTIVASRFQHALLLGPAWNWASNDFSKTFSVQVMYKQYFNGQGRKGFAGFQTTLVWGDTFANGLCTFSGFVDLWYDKDANGKLILLSEPQFWFNLNTVKGWDKFNLSLGGEVEISNNFVYNKDGKNNRFYAIPTLAAKWTF